MRVTIGLPFYNNQYTLADAIRSVFAQTFQDWELILVDDGSTDNSLSIAQAVKDPRVRVFSDGVNRRLPHRLNQIANLACGEYVARMDADDLMHPERIAHQVQYLDTNQEVDLVSAGVCTIDAQNHPVGVRGLTAPPTKPLAVLRQGLFSHPASFGRAKWFRDNPYDETFVLSQDRELWCRTYQSTKFANLPEVLYFYREYPSVSLRKYITATQILCRVFSVYGPSLVGKPRTALLILESYLKVMIYIAFSALGLRKVLVARRNRPLDEIQRSVTSEAIARVLSTQVPGLPD
jgi:glycosyltransferase involved in cell wall biosynthesis